MCRNSDEARLQQQVAETRRLLHQAEAWLSISAYAAKYHVSRTTVYKWLEKGLLPAFKEGRVHRVGDQPPKNLAA